MNKSPSNPPASTTQNKTTHRSFSNFPKCIHSQNNSLRILDRKSTGNNCNPWKSDYFWILLICDLLVHQACQEMQPFKKRGKTQWSNLQHIAMDSVFFHAFIVLEWHWMVRSRPAGFSPLFLKGCISWYVSEWDGVKCTVFGNNLALRVQC